MTDDSLAKPQKFGLDSVFFRRQVGLIQVLHPVDPQDS